MGVGSPPPAAPTPKPSAAFADLAGFCDGVPGLDRSAFASHVGRLQEGLRTAGLDAIVVEPGPTMFHLTGVRWGTSERLFAVVIPAVGRPWWVCPAFEAGRAEERAGSGADLRLWHEHEDPYALVAAGLPPKAERIAVGPGMRHFVYAGIAKAAAPRLIVSGREVVRDLRMIKGEQELRLMDRANRATKAALRRVAAMTRVGMKESEVRSLIVAAQRTAGLSNVWALVLFGPNAAFPHGTGQERTLEAGDLVLIDTGGQLHGYCSDITRTWPVGPASDEARRVFDVVLEAQTAAFSKLGPGVPCQEVDAAARAVITKAGFGPDYAAFVHRLGHGIGLQGHEDPYLVRGNGLILAPGMTMSNEPGIYIRGQIGVRIEDIVAITASGYRVFGPTVPSFDAPV